MTYQEDMGTFDIQIDSFVMENHIVAAKASREFRPEADGSEAWWAEVRPKRAWKNERTLTVFASSMEDMQKKILLAFEVLTPLYEEEHAIQERFTNALKGLKQRLGSKDWADNDRWSE